MLDLDRYPIVALSKVCDDFRPGFARQPNEGRDGTFQLRMPNISRSGYISLDDRKYVTCTDEERNRYRVQSGDVIFNNTNSPELVGNAALYLESEHCVLSNHMTRIRTRDQLLDPGYLAWSLHYYWATKQTQGRAKQWINQAAIDLDTLATFKIPLPPLSEQRRIVAILQEAEAVRETNIKASALSSSLPYSLLASAIAHSPALDEVDLGDIVNEIQSGWSPIADERPADSSEWGVLKLSAISSSRYLEGENKALYSHTEPREDLEIKKGDVLFSRKNTPNLVGACAYVHSTRPRLFFPDLIFRLSLKDDAPCSAEYLWTLLSSPWFSPKVRRLADGAAQSMVNISKEKLKRLRIPFPDKSRLSIFQEMFASATAAHNGQERTAILFPQISKSLSAHAFSGTLTATWREHHRDLLTQEADERDALLAAQGATSTRPVDIQITGKLLKTATDLTTEQHFVYMRCQREPSESRYVTAQLLAKEMEGRLHNDARTIDGHLMVLADRGLLIPVSQEIDDPDAGTIYARAYRLPREDGDDGPGDRAKTAELARLASLCGGRAR